MADLGQTSRTISAVDKVREAAPSRTVSPSVGSFQDMAFRKPSQDDTVVHRAPLPRLMPLPPSQREPPPSTGEDIPATSSDIQELEPIRTLPDMEADATSDELQVLERRTKSRNEAYRPGREDAGTNANEEVIGRLKRKKGHLKVHPHERDNRLTSAEEDVNLKRNRIAGGSRRSRNDFEDDTAEDSSSSDEGAGKESDTDLKDAPQASLGTPGGKEPVAGTFAHVHELSVKGSADHNTGKTTTVKKGKRGPPPNRKIMPMKTRAAAQKGRQ
jgi:hypothetical protein